MSWPSLKKPPFKQRLFEKVKSEQWKKNGERFGLGVALATAIMSAWAMYRGHMQRAELLQIVSASLLAAGLVAPRLLYPFSWLLETAFKTATRALMYALLILVFFLVFAPVGIAIRLLKKDPLMTRLEPDAESYWMERKPKDPKRAEKQF